MSSILRQHLVIKWVKRLMSAEVRNYPNYPTSETNPAAPLTTGEVVGDVVIEFNRQGQVLQQFSLLDVLDPYRFAYDGLATNATTAPFGPNATDWSHANAAFRSADGGTLVSLRHQDAVVKLDSNGDLSWILGSPEGWNGPLNAKRLTPLNPNIRWPRHQHAVKMTSQDTVMIYDNGNHQAIPFTPSVGRDTYSRAVEYRVDEQNRTVEEVWSFGGPTVNRFFSFFVSDADLLPVTGNVQITDGGRVRGMDGNDEDSARAGHHFARILEVTHTTPAEVLLEIVIDDLAPQGWNVYRSERIANLYGV